MIFIFLILRASNRTHAVCKPFSVVLTVCNIWLLELLGLILFSSKPLLNSADRFAPFYFVAVEEVVGELLQAMIKINKLYVRSLCSNLLLSAATTTGSPTSTATPTTTGSPTSKASPAGNVGGHEWCGTDRFVLSSVLSSTQNRPARTTL